MENKQENSSTGWEKANLNKSLASDGPVSQSEGSDSPDLNDSDVTRAVSDVDKNEHQDLGKENLGNEPEEKAKGDAASPYKMNQTLDDKRPEDDSIKKGWTVDSNTSRGPQDKSL